MLPAFLLPETTVNRNGESAAMPIGAASGLLLFTMGVLEVIEQQSLLVGIYGSPDGKAWDPHPAVEFPEKFYTGTSAVLIDLTEEPEMRFARAQWKVNRWGRGGKQPKFTFYLFVEGV